MNPELWKLKRDNRTPEPTTRHEQSARNDFSAVMPMRGAVALASIELPGAIEPGQTAGRWIEPGDGAV